MQGDVIEIYNTSGSLVMGITYDAWGNFIDTISSQDVPPTIEQAMALGLPFRYRSYYYDSETGFYYVSSRYYDPEIGRWINADNQLSTGSDLTGMNLFAYCGNNPVNRIDPTGEAWWHWAIGAAIVAACAVATIATCGGFAAAASAVMLVASGTAAASTSATVAAAAFIGSSVAFGMSAFIAADTSSSAEEFYDKGDWGTVAATAGGAILGAGYGYDVYNSSNCISTSNDANTAKHTQGMGSPKNNVNPNGSYTKLDNNGKIYSYTQFDSKGRQAMRIDFQGRPHAGVLPHIHAYNYLERGGRIEHVYDLYWNPINQGEYCEQNLCYCYYK